MVKWIYVFIVLLLAVAVMVFLVHERLKHLVVEEFQEKVGGKKQLQTEMKTLQANCRK